MIGRQGLRTSFRRLFSSLVRSVGRSVSRAFVCSFVCLRILFISFYSFQTTTCSFWFVLMEKQKKSLCFVLFCFFILTSLQSNSTSKERAARAVNLHCTCKVFPRPQEWLICILSVFDTRTNFQEMASFWGRNNWQGCFENFEFTKITMIWHFQPEENVGTDTLKVSFDA